MLNGVEVAITTMETEPIKSKLINVETQTITRVITMTLIMPGIIKIRGGQIRMQGMIIDLSISFVENFDMRPKVTGTIS